MIELWCLPKTFKHNVLAIETDSFKLVRLNRTAVPDKVILSSFVGTPHFYTMPKAGDERTLLIQLLTSCFQQLITLKEKQLMVWFNSAGWYTQKFHSLNFLKNLTSKNVQKIIELRKSQPFETLGDLTERTGIDMNVVLVETLVNEILTEKIRVAQLLTDA